MLLTLKSRENSFVNNICFSCPMVLKCYTEHSNDTAVILLCSVPTTIGWLDFTISWFNTLRPRQNGRHFADDISKRIFLNEKIWIPIKISLKFVPKGSSNNIPALVQIMAWRRPGDKPLSEPMMVNLPTHICVTGPQWVKMRFGRVLYCTIPQYSIPTDIWHNNNLLVFAGPLG